MSNNNRALLIIDAQNDFHDIPGAALPVPGAVKDTERIAALIKKTNPGVIFSSLDSHHSLDIAHKAWFNKADGTPVDDFTTILADDVKNGKYVARIDPVRTLKYLEDLEIQGEFKHMIWPDHCLIGTTGHALHPVYFAAIKQWMIDNLKWVNYIYKGSNPFTEHFGIFRANIPIKEDVTTNVDQRVFTTLNNQDEVWLGGQARTHCVANTLKQLLQISPQLAPKLVVLEDCTSNVANLPGDFYAMVDGIYADAKSKGVRFSKSTDL